MRTLNPREGKIVYKEMTDLSFQKGIFNLHQGEMCLGAIALIYFKNSLSKQSNFLRS